MRPRLAAEGDRAELLRMADRFIDEGPYREHLVKNLPHLELLVTWLLEHGLVLVAGGDVGAPLAAMFGMGIVPQPVSGELVATELVWWVEPDHRGGPVGVRLWEEAERWAMASGAALVHMVQPVGNTRVGQMYARRSYVPLETTWQLRLQESP